jgi:hypothetical protein
VLDRLLRRRAAPPDGPLTAELKPVASEVAHENDTWMSGFTRNTPTGAALLDRPVGELPDLVLDALAVAAAPDTGRTADERILRRCGADLAAAALRRRLAFDDAQLVRLVDRLVDIGTSSRFRRLFAGIDPVKPVVLAVERHAAGGRAPASLHRGLRRVAALLEDDAEGRRVALRIAALIGENATAEPKLPRKDPWVRALYAARDALPAEDRAGAGRMLALAATADTARPKKAFIAERDRLVADERGRRVAVVLLSAAAAERGSGGEDGGPPPEVGDVLRGLVWIAAGAGGEDAARALAEMALAGWRKLPWFGPLCAKAANAAIAALGEIPEGAAQLGHLHSRLKRPTAVQAVDAAIDRAAETLGIPRDEFEERVVPDFGLDRDGRRTVSLGEHTAELDAAGALTFGTRKSVPKAVKTGHPDELAELKAAAKEIKAMAGSQRLRLERLLLDDRSWTGAAFRERYLEHGLVGPLARRLIWTVDGVATLGADIAALADDATVRLWHPVDAAPAEVRDWRARLEEREITQPFKQAHREIYLLTDAERETETYSNRFAAHVLRQHQMAALAHGRGWRYTLQGEFDSGEQEARLELPRHGLSAAFWLDWPSDGELGQTGIYIHVLSDQVRISDGAGPVPLKRVPVRVFSEVMRDVDLLVGVTSIGNDPTWGDRGDQPFADYWRGFAFGELTEQATVRREVLERLLPKLAIADVATVDDRYLRVRGRLATYRIHLGSANILMEPNDEYLCIVGDRGASPGRLYLPFEGDQVLALILSKALLLARDDKIEDRTILSQIRRGR